MLNFSLMNLLWTINSVIILQFHSLSFLSKIPGFPGLVFLPPISINKMEGDLFEINGEKILYADHPAIIHHVWRRRITCTIIRYILINKLWDQTPPIHIF